MNKLFEKSYFLNGFLFAAFIVVMFFQSLPAIWTYFSENITGAESLLDGKLMRGFENNYDESIFLRQPSIAGWGWLRYQLLEEGQAGVVPGKNGWLFTNEEYFQENRIELLLEKQLVKIKTVHDKLNEQGKKLIMLPVPMKTDIYEEFTRVSPSSGTSQLYESLLTELANLGIASVNIRDVFIHEKNNQPLFFKTDTHWTPFGASIAAKTVAEMFPELVGDKSFQTKAIGENEFEGDLINFYATDYLQNETQFSKEKVIAFETLEDANVFSEAMLFGENPVSIALVGSSYSEIERWHFSGSLKNALKADLVTIANRRLGPFAAMEQFEKDGYISDPDIEFVIWEFPVRTVFFEESLSNEGWQETMESIF